MEGVDLPDPDVSQNRSFIALVDLGLRTGHHLETTVQPAQSVISLTGQLGRDAWSRHGEEHLHPLIRAAEPMLGDETLMDHAAPQRHIRPPAAAPSAD